MDRSVDGYYMEFGNLCYERVDEDKLRSMSENERISHVR